MYDNNEKFQSIMHNAELLHLNVKEIKVLYCIHKAGEITQHDIERQADLRQPEVSLAIKHLSSMDMLENVQMQNPVNGRPVNCYHLKRPVSEYFASVKKQKEQEWMMTKLALDDMSLQFAE